MRVRIAENGDFVFMFRADEVNMGLDILKSMEPKDEESEQAIQHSINLLLDNNHLHEWAIIN